MLTALICIITCALRGWREHVGHNTMCRYLRGEKGFSSQDVYFSIQPRKNKMRRKGKGSFVPVAYKCLPVSFAVILWIVYNPDTNQLKKDLFWLVFIPLLAFVLLHSEWLRQCQSQIKIKSAVLLWEKKTGSRSLAGKIKTRKKEPSPPPTGQCQSLLSIPVQLGCTFLG